METCLNNKKIMKIAKELFKKYQICDNCLGRLFKKIEANSENEDIGERLRRSINILNKIDQKNVGYVLDY